MAELRLSLPPHSRFGLSFVGGFVDTFGFVACSGCSRHVTGNFVLIGARCSARCRGRRQAARPAGVHGDRRHVCLIVRAHETLTVRSSRRS